jgi:hypothetical protein
MRQFLTFSAMIDGEVKDFKVYSPIPKDYHEAQKARNIAFAEAIRSNAILRSQLKDIFKQRGLWDDMKEAEYKGLQAEIASGIKALDEGGIKLSAARNIALDIRKKRAEMQQMLFERSQLEGETAEGQAENARFNYLVYACTYLVYDKTESRFFNSMDDYLNSEHVDVSYQAGATLGNMLYGINDSEISLPENKFLLDFKFIDKNMRFVDSRGRLTDQEGRLIDESGRYINENGDYVDIEGSLVDLAGNYQVEKKPFLDDDGNEIVVETTEVAESNNDEKEEIPKKRRKRKSAVDSPNIEK